MVMRQCATSLFDLLHNSAAVPAAVARLRPGGAALRPRERTRLLLEAAEGLAFLHGVGVAHLDVKSMNLMLTFEGAVQVADFGLSRFVDPATGRTPDQSILGWGSLPWMAPELINEEPQSLLKADVFR
jgi:serine/threonine protein kinase